MAEPEPSRDVPLSDDYLREIGRVAVEWSKTEAEVESIIWAFLFVDYMDTSPWFREAEGRAVTTHINLLLRVDIMLSLASAALEQMPNLKGELEQFAAAIRTQYPVRNKIVHGLWAPVAHAALRQHYRARGTVSPLFEIMTVEQIGLAADDIRKLTDKLVEFQPRLFEALFELRKVWPEPAPR